MDTQKFQELIVASKIASNNFPLAGTSMLYPYGKKIKDKLESIILSKYQEIGYEEVELPNVVPEILIDHLDLTNIFTAKNECNKFYLAPGFETQSIILSNDLIKSYKNLPLKIYSKDSVFRQTTKVPFIKEMTMNICEFNSFFSSAQEMYLELDKFNEIAKNILTSLEIPFIQTKDEFGPDAQYKFYAYFPFSKKFGSTFCNVAVGKKYTQKHSDKFNDANCQKQTPFQLNASFTSRVLFAYLANHADEKGFNFPLNIAPYHAAISTNEFTPERLEYVKKILNTNKISFTLINGCTNSEAFNKFIASGIPIQIGAGQHEYKLRTRNCRVIWTNEAELENNINNLLETYTPSVEKNNMTVCETDKNIDEIDAATIYLVPTHATQSLKLDNLKKIGLTPDELNTAYVSSKY